MKDEEPSIRIDAVLGEYLGDSTITLRLIDEDALYAHAFWGNQGSMFRNALWKFVIGFSMITQVNR